MQNKDSSFLRARCDSCGGPLNPPDRTGRMICDYCGAVYLSNQRSPAAPPVEAYPLETEPPESYTPPPGMSESKPNPLQKIGCIAILVSVILAAVLIVGSGGLLAFSTTSKTARQVQPKPEMLAALPGSPVMAGTPVNYADWGLTVAPEISVQDGALSIKMTLVNYSGSEQILRYKPNSISVMDDRGNVYKPKAGSCQSDLLYLDRQVSIAPNQKVTIASEQSWCGNNSIAALPLYNGVIPLDATRIIIHFDGFGVFKDFEVVVKL